MTTFSTSLKLELPGDGQQTGVWGQTTNRNLGTLLEQAITGVQSITMLDTNYTLTDLNGTSDEARNAVIIVNGTNTATRDVIAPNVNKLYAIYNNTTGGQAVRIIGATGTGVTVPNGIIAQVFCDGTNFYSMLNGTVGSFTVASLLTAAAITSTGALNATTITASTQFTGPGTGLTGTASALNIGGNAATATTATTANALNTANTYQGTRFTGTSGTYTPISNPSTSAFVGNGSYGGGFGLVDGVYGISLYSSSGTLVFGLGSNTSVSSKATLDSSGNFTANANVTAYSDERLKKNWADLPSDFIERLAQVKSGTYERIDKNLKQVGVSAQSLNDLMPEAVLTDPDGTLSVAYGNAALAAVVELAKEIVNLKAEIKQLKGE